MLDEQHPWAPSVIRDAGEDDTDVYMVGIRETTDPEAWSLLFMDCCDADDEQEIALGMDTYCLVVDPGQATFYGGVRACELTDNELWLTLTEDAAAALGMPTQVRFVVDLSAHQTCDARPRPPTSPVLRPPGCSPSPTPPVMAPLRSSRPGRSGDDTQICGWSHA